MTKIYVFDEKGEAEVLTGTTDRHECFREVAKTVRWDTSPDKAPQLPY